VPATNRLKGALQPLNENLPGEPKTQANRLKGKSQELCSLHHRGTDQKGVKTFTVQPLARGVITPASQNHRIVGVGRDLCGSSSPTPLPKQGHLQ